MAHPGNPSAIQQASLSPIFSHGRTRAVIDGIKARAKLSGATDAPGWKEWRAILS
jgi:hypothetical protein